MSCCYAIVFNNNLYYYIGSSTDIINRVKTHNSTIRDSINRIFMTNHKEKTKPFEVSILPYFIPSEILENHELCYKIQPIYISTNYLKKFEALYPQYRLSKGEWIILKYITDLIVKILEQSLIDKFKPKLNTIQKVGMRPWSWHDSYLDEISN